MFTILDYSSTLGYSIIRRYTNIVYYYYYVYLRTSIILYKNTAYLGGGEMMYSPVLFNIGGGGKLPLPHRIDALAIN